MPDITHIELVIAGLGAIATVTATYFAWRAVREGKDTVALARETVEVGRETLAIEKQNLSNLQETTRLSQQSLELAEENLTAARTEHDLMERAHLTVRLERAGEAVVAIYIAATRIENHVVTAGIDFAAARARFRTALAGLPQDLNKSRKLVDQGADPAGLGIIKRTWTEALIEIEAAITALEARSRADSS